MKVTYDPEVDVLRILFRDAPIGESDEDKPGVILDLRLRRQHGGAGSAERLATRGQSTRRGIRRHGVTTAGPQRATANDETENGSGSRCPLLEAGRLADHRIRGSFARRRAGLHERKQGVGAEILNLSQRTPLVNCRELQFQTA